MSGARRSPTAVRRALALELRTRRIAAGLTVEKASAAVGMSQSKLTQIERAGQVPSRDEVIKLLGTYGGASEEDRDGLLSLVRDSKHKEWWESIHALPPKLKVYLGLESVASSLLAYNPALAHGLLQTEDYARAVIRSGKPDVLAHELDQLVDARIRRQAEVLDREGPDEPPPLELWSVMDEAVLRRQVGGPKVMRAQLERLIEASARPNVTLQVLPFGLGAHAGMAGTLTILQFEPSDHPVVYVDGHAGNLYLERDEDLRRAQQVMNRILADALAPDRSLALMREISEETTK